MRESRTGIKRGIEKREMVHGLKFSKITFLNFLSNIIIGGTLHILMKYALSSFRTTKDLDIVLIFEALNDSFSKRFWKFISDGEYKNKIDVLEKSVFIVFRILEKQVSRCCR